MNSDIVDKMMESMNIEDMDELEESMGLCRPYAARGRNSQPDYGPFQSLFPNLSRMTRHGTENGSTPGRRQSGSKRFRKAASEKSTQKEKQKVKTKNLDNFATDLTAKQGQPSGPGDRRTVKSAGHSDSESTEQKQSGLIGEPGVGRPPLRKVWR